MRLFCTAVAGSGAMPAATIRIPPAGPSVSMSLMQLEPMSRARKLLFPRANSGVTVRLRSPLLRTPMRTAGSLLTTYLHTVARERAGAHDRDAMEGGWRESEGRRRAREGAARRIPPATERLHPRHLNAPLTSLDPLPTPAQPSSTSASVLSTTQPHPVLRGSPACRIAKRPDPRSSDRASSVTERKGCTW